MLHLMLWFPAAVGWCLCPRPFPWLLSGLIWSGLFQSSFCSHTRASRGRALPLPIFYPNPLPTGGKESALQVPSLAGKRMLKIASEGNWRTVYWSQRAQEPTGRRQQLPRGYDKKEKWKLPLQRTRWENQGREKRRNRALRALVPSVCEGTEHNVAFFSG